MVDVTHPNADAIYNHFKKRNQEHYQEEKHCKLLVTTLGNSYKGTVSSFCVEAMICERTFYNWVETHELFNNIYYYCKMLARECWEKEGRSFQDKEYQIGTITYDFEYWKMKGWSRFGISRNSKIKIKSKENENAIQLYSSILKQASEGDFTASEFKQLMEAVNVGLNVHQISAMQKEIDDIKNDCEIMKSNQNGNDRVANTGIEEANKDTV